MNIPPDDPKWDEFHDIDIINWKRIRSSIEHENSLTNHRFTWLFNTQAFLFTAFVLILQASTKTDVDPNQKDLYPFVLATFASAGILTALYFQRPLWLAKIQHDKLRELWFETVADQNLHPPISGYYHTPKDRFFPQHNIPYIFVVAWIALILSVLTYRSELREIVKPYLPRVGILLLVLVVVVGTLSFGITIGRRQAKYNNLVPGDTVKNLGPNPHDWVKAKVIEFKRGGYVVVERDNGRRFSVRRNQLLLIKPPASGSEPGEQVAADLPGDPLTYPSIPPKKTSK